MARQPNGQPRRPAPRDKGTEELQARRNFMAGKGDPQLTTFPLGILLANSEISHEEYRAGCKFAWLHATVIGQDSLAAIDFERTYGKILREIDEEKEEDLQAKWDETLKWFDSRRQREEVTNLCVYERTPRFMRPVLSAPRDIIQGKIILKGLVNLADAYGYYNYHRHRRAV